MLANIIRNRKKTETGGLPVSGAALWLDASQQNTLFTDAGTTPVTSSGQSIYQWNDLSGNNRHAIQATSGNRPTWSPPASGQNGLGVISFDGVNDSLSGNFGTASIMNSTFALHGVFQWTSNANTGPVFFYSGDRTTFRDRILWYYTGNGRYDQYASGIVGASMTSSTWYRFSLTKNSLTSVTLEINGTSVTGTVSNANITSTIYQLASIKAETAGYAQMKWAELVLYPSTQSSGDQASVMNYLKAKWGTP